MASIQGFARGENARFILPRVIESTFGTENFGTAANCLYGLGFFDGEAPGDDVEITTDREVMSGFEFETEQIYGRRSTSFQFTLPWTDVTFAWAMARAFGADAVTAGDSANDKVHTFTRYAKTNGIPGFSMQYQTKDGTADSVLDIRILGVQIARLRGEWSRTGHGRLIFSCISSGRKGTVSNLDETAMVQACLGQLWFPSNKITIGLLESTTHKESPLSSLVYDPPTAAGTFSNMDEGGTLVQLGQELESCWFEIDNDLDEARAAAAGASSGAGVYGEQAPIGGNRTYRSGMTVLVPDAGGSGLLHDLFAKPGSGTSDGNKAYALVIESVGDVLQASSSSTDYRGTSLKIPHARVMGKPKSGHARGLRTASVEFSAMKDRSSSDYDEAKAYASTPATTAYSATS